MADVRAMKDMFTSSSLAPLLDKLTLHNKSGVHEMWSGKSNDSMLSQQLIRRIGQFSFMKTESVAIIFSRASKIVLWSRSATNGYIMQESDSRTGLKIKRLHHHFSSTAFCSR